MKKKKFIISLLAFTGVLLSSCALARQKQELVWSKWYDNGDGTHSRHNINDISVSETDVHHFVLTSTFEEPTEVAPGKAIYTCEECACKEEKVVPPTGNYVFDQKVVDDKYLLERYSEHSAAYYMSSIEGAFGDPRYVFEVSDIPSGYTEVDYVESDGRQWIDTGIENNGTREVSINNSSKSSRLGVDYTELEYIESNGTQFIKSGVRGYAKWTFTIQFTKLDTRQLMGYNSQGGNYWGVSNENSTRGTEEGDYETYIPWSGHRKAGNKDIIIDDFDTNPGKIRRFLNGECVYGPNDVNGDLSNVEYQILALGANSFCHAKLYSVKVEKGGSTICDFVPAQERSTGRIGLFDIVSNKFLANAGTGEFIKGSEVEYNPVHLPEGYQEVQYLEATGTQKIDLNTPFNLETGSIKVSYQATVEDQTGMIFGVKNDEAYVWLFHTKASGGFNFYVRGNSEGQQPLGYDTLDCDRHNVEYNNKTYFRDGVQRDTAKGELASVPNLYLFSQGPAYYYQGRIYSFSLDNGEGLVRDLVPCYRISDGKTGMYDLVSNQLFTNSGTGEFIRGSEINPKDIARDYNDLEKADIPEYYYQLNFVESTGLQVLDTGVVGGAKIDATLKFSKNSTIQIMGYNSTDGLYFGVGADNKYLGTAIEAGNIDNISVDISNTTANKATLKINDEEPVNFTIPSLEDDTLKLFSNGTEINRCVVLMYSVKIYQGLNLVRNFVPVMQKQTSAVGLYDLVEKRFYESTNTNPLEAGGIMFEDIDTSKINVFCNLNSNKSHPNPSKIFSYKIYEGDDLLRDFVSVIRNSDGIAGLYDLKNNEFYTSNSEFQLTYGKIIGHKLDEGRVAKKPTYNEQGEMIYKCIYTGEEIHVKTDCTSYKATFLSNNGNLTEVKIFNNNDPSNYYLSMVGYTRNVNTYNYSKSGAYIHFEIPDDGNEYTVETTSGKVNKVTDQPRQFKITNIKSDVFIQLKVK